MVTNLNDTSDKNTHTKIANPQEYHDKLDKGIYLYMKKLDGVGPVDNRPSTD